MAYGSGYAGGYADTVSVSRLVEIEFDAGVWTDVTSDVVALTTRRGRNKESGSFETGVMTISLRNDDRTYDPDHSTGPYYGKLRPNRRVRFTANYIFDFPIFQGYIDRISQVYGGPNDATAEIQVSDLFKLMNRVDLPGSAWAAEVAEDTPTHWWRLGEPSGSTVLVDAGSSPVAGTAVGATLGETGAPVRDPDGSASFDGVDDYLTFGSAGMVTGYPYTIELWLKIPTRATTGNYWFFAQNRSGGTSAPRGWVTGTDLGDPGKVWWDGVQSTARVDDDAWHHVVLKASAAGAGNQTLYIDGVSQGTGTPAAPAGNELLIGTPDHPAFSALSNHPWPGQIDEIAIYPAALSLSRVEAHNDAARTPWDGELSGARLVRIAELAGITDTNIQSGSTTLQATSLGGSALAYAQKVEETEAGRLFVSADGDLTFISRLNAETGTYLTSQATLVDDDSGAGRPYRSVSAEVDEATIVTRATVSRDGSVAVTYQDDAIDEFGIIDETHEGLLHDSDSHSESYAQWIVNTHKTPTTRIGMVELALHKDPTNMYPDILGLEIGDRVTYKRKPQNTGAVFSQAMRVEAIEHHVERLTWDTRLQLSPFSLTPGPLWVLDTVGASELGQTTYLGF